MGRYTSTGTDFPQPIRKILPSSQDIIHTLIMGQRLDNVAEKYYSDPTLGWIIMCANPQFDNEFQITPGTQIRIPFPLSRVYNSWRTSPE